MASIRTGYTERPSCPFLISQALDKFSLSGLEMNVSGGTAAEV